ncbi:MAG: hypothetical protein M1339_08715 [Bacteroidetes bacterium]|nr:hypothetical protein [Bacteroidota bacterium]
MAKRRPPKVQRGDSSVEFKLLVEPFEDSLSRRSGVAFLFRTSEEFQNFPYELVVESRQDGSKLFFDITGLRTPISDFPRPGPAMCVCEIENLGRGNYTIVVDRRGKQVNQFRISVNKGVKLLRSTNQRKFIDIFTDRNKWALLEG